MDRRDFIRDSAMLGGSILASRYISFGQVQQSEILAKRTLTQKTFDLGNGSKRLNAHIGHIHFQSGALKTGAMSEIDTTLNYNALSAKYQMTAASYEAEIGLYGDVHFHNVDSSIEFALENPNRVQAEAYTGSAFGKIGKALIWRDIIDKGAHQIVECRNGSLVKIFHFDTPPKSLQIDFACNMTNMDFDAFTTAKPTAEKAFVLQPSSIARSLELKSTSKTTYIRKATAWNHRGESIGIELSFYLDKGGLLRAVKTLPQGFVDKTFSELGAWLECDTTTSYYVGAGDGGCWIVGTVWSTIRGASSGTASNSGSYDYIAAYLSGGNYSVRRLFLPIDTSGLPDAATISAASLNLCNYYAGDNAGTIAIIQTSQASPTTIAGSDFSALTLNTPVEGATRYNPYGVWTRYTYHAFPLNANGIGWISKTGWTLLGCRIGTYDVDDTAPPSAAIYHLIYMSEQTSTSQDPYLDVTYSEGGGARRKPPVVVTY